MIYDAERTVTSEIVLKTYGYQFESNYYFQKLVIQLNWESSNEIKTVLIILIIYYIYILQLNNSSEADVRVTSFILIVFQIFKTHFLFIDDKNLVINVKYGNIFD